MNYKSKCPCTKHYREYKDAKELREGTKSVGLMSTEEFQSIYDPHCPDCREAYKEPGNNALFHLRWWKRNCRLNAWIFGIGHFPLSIYLIYLLFNKGPLEAIKNLFWCRSHYDQYQQLALPFITVNWAPLEFADIREGWVDLSDYYEDKPSNDPKWKEYDEETRHLIKVARRYQRMWEKQLKAK